MDCDEIRYLMAKCIHLKYYFYGVFATDNFPKLTREGYHSQCFTVATRRKSLDGSFVSRKQSLFGRSAWYPDTKLPIIVLPTVKILQ